MNTKKRLTLFLKEKGIGQTFFEESSGLSKGQLAKKQGLTSSSLEKIANYIPSLNMNWLLTGQGEMETSAIPTKVNVDDKTVPYFIYAELKEKIEMLEEKNEGLIRENERYKTLLENNSIDYKQSIG